MANGSVMDWIVEHVLKLVELFVVVPIGIVVALLSLVVVAPWQLIRTVIGSDTIPAPPAALIAVVKWPYRALKHIVTGSGGFQWMPQV